MLVAQAGYGRGDKVGAALEAGLVGGVILSPKDERRARLEACVTELRAAHHEAMIMIDPQFYVTTVNAPRDGKLQDYDYYSENAGLNRTQFGPRQVQDYVRACLDYQYTSLNGISYVVSPTVLFDDFRDLWSQIALNMAEASIDYHSTLDEPAPLLVSVVTSELALRTATGLSEFLDVLSSLETRGFYVVINRSGQSYQSAMDQRAMENLLYLVHVLAQLNDYFVVVGYSDWLGLLLHAAGAAATATGWHQGLRQFSMSRFEPATGGRRPRKRYSSAPMLSSPLIIPELEDIQRAGLLESVLTGSDYDDILRPSPARGESRWTDEIACLAHWAALNQVMRAVEDSGGPVNRVDTASRLILDAEGHYDRLGRRGINFEPQTGPGHLGIWRETLAGFRNVAGV